MKFVFSVFLLLISSVFPEQMDQIQFLQVGISSPVLFYRSSTGKSEAEQSKFDDFYLGMQKQTWKHVAILSFQSLGVVYGRISTAPLYVFGTVQTEDFVSDQTAHELFSFIFWTLTIISLLKYAFIVLRADDDGEGEKAPSMAYEKISIYRDFPD